jgi:hypothetical protein
MLTLLRLHKPLESNRDRLAPDRGQTLHVHDKKGADATINWRATGRLARYWGPNSGSMIPRRFMQSV